MNLTASGANGYLSDAMLLGYVMNRFAGVGLARPAATRRDR